MEEAAKYFKGKLLYSYGSYSGLTSHVSLLKQNRKLIHYPVWRVLGFTKKGRFKCLLDAVSSEPVYIKQNTQARAEAPTKNLLIVMALAMAMGIALAPGGSYDGWLALVGLFIMAAFWAGGIALNRWIMDRLAEKAARMIWRV